MDHSAPSVVRDYCARTGVAIARVIPLTGDASGRRYVRVLPVDGAPFVLAVHAQPFRYADLPFVNVAELFGRLAVPVPRILGHAEDLGVLALEDLGDVTLQAHLGAVDDSRRLALYREAVALIATLQRRGQAFADPTWVPYQQSFDEAKLTWELDYFVRHFLEGYRGIALSSTEREGLGNEWHVITGELASEPRVLCHRDYHSRNLMLPEPDRLVVIDFQDARLGPDTYDLVSLLRDSYVDLPDGAVDELIEHFLALQGQSTDAAQFRRRFDLMAVQRNLKALGTFGYQATVRQNPVYAQYVPRTLAYVRATVTGTPRFARLGELLARHLPELR